MVAGVQPGIPLFRSYGWHTYNWANYGPVYAGGAFTAVTVDQLTGTSARVNFTPQFAGNARLAYGAGYGTTEDSATVACAAGTPASITLENLAPGTLYTFVIFQYASLTDQTGYLLVQTGYSDQGTFVTIGGSNNPVAPIISNPNVVVTGQGNNKVATITWDTNVPTINKVQYGLTASYGTTRNDTFNQPNNTGARVVIGNLNQGQTFHYQCSSQGRDQAHSLTATTADLTFNT